jgi:hypothetical protein
VTPAPSRLEYGYGFDLAASWLGGDAGPLLAVVSTPEFVDHVLSRAEGAVVFVCEDARTYDHAARRLTGGDLPGDLAKRCQLWPAGAASAAGQAGVLPVVCGSAVWAAPQPDTWPARLAAIGRLLGGGGSVCVLTGTGVAALTRPLRARRDAGEPAPLSGRLRAGLAAGGWQVTRARGYALLLARRAAGGGAGS